MNNRELWQYYFGQLPCYAMSRRYRMPDLVALEQESSCQAGAAYLRECLGGEFTIIPDAEIARRASWVRLWRESGAYDALGLTPRKFSQSARLEGHEHLLAAATLGRPLILLTAHVGNPYLACATLANAGYPVFPVARSVDRSETTPMPVQWFLRLNYWASERKLNRGHYLYTDFSGKFDKRITTVLRQSNALCVNLIDMPATLYGGKRYPVTFLGKPALLPVNFIHWARKKRAVFLTYWNGFGSDFSDNCTPHRWVRIESLIETDSAEGVLQTYAERLSALITREPWQWMGLPIASQYHQTVQPSRL
jgi:lauroyl/myristoyl acyltransferase